MKGSILIGLGLMAASTASATDASTAWTDKISVSGDVRIRHEYVNKTRVTDTADTHKERFRLRLGVNGQVNEAITAKTRIASSDGGNAISNNTTMTDNASKKALYIDVAAIEWKMCEAASTTLGKQDNPLRLISKSELLYDADYTPEGASLSTGKSLMTRWAAFSIQERSPGATSTTTTTTTTSEPDSWLLAGMVAYKSDFSEAMSGTFGVGYHNFTALKKNAAVGAGFLGNTNTGSRYIHDYQVAELLAEMKWSSAGQALSVYADAIQNFGAEEDNTGLLGGVQWQLMNDQGKASWTFGYAYQTIGKDATLSAANNSDLNNGNDGGIGHIFSAGKQVATNTNLNLTVYSGRIDNAGDPYSIDRAHLDLVVNF